MVTTQQYHRKSPSLEEALMLQQQSPVASELTLDLAKKLKGDRAVGVARKLLDHVSIIPSHRLPRPIRSNSPNNLSPAHKDLGSVN